MLLHLLDKYNAVDCGFVPDFKINLYDVSA